MITPVTQMMTTITMMMTFKLLVYDDADKTVDHVVVEKRCHVDHLSYLRNTLLPPPELWAIRIG
jgi:hypothetical protein